MIGESFSLDGMEYTVSKKIGDGGFSEVFKAEASFPLHEPLAVKVLLPQYASDSAWRKRFEREAAILANLDHLHVVRIRATLDRPDGSFAIIQDFIENAQNLRQFFAATEGEVRQQLSVALQILYGLRQAHKSDGGGAIHRDLSPSNVLIDQGGIAKIIDFGLAKAVNSKTAITVKGVGYGTPGCVSPEQAKDFATASPLTDIYALGKTLAASLQDREPEHADCAALTDPWRGICVKMVNYDTAGRYQSCDQVIEDLLDKFFNFTHDGECYFIIPANMVFHAKEFSSWDAVPIVWCEVINKYVSGYEFSGDKNEIQSVLEFLANDVVADPRSGLLANFKMLEVNLWNPLFEGLVRASYSSTDRMGKLLREWLPLLKSEDKLVGFRRLVRTSVSYHRYSIMGNVRSAFREEKDKDIRAKFLEILHEEDPGKVIYRISGHSTS